MNFYRAAPVNAIPAGQDGADDTGHADLAAGLPGAAPLIAIRVADLVSPAGRPLAEGDRTALAVAGTPEIRAGDQLLFVKVVVIAPAVVRRDGRIQAAGHPACHARLGALEQQLDELAGPGAIDEIAAQATQTGKVKGDARRAMTAALTIRATVLMSVMPDADYDKVMAALLGDLVLVPWHRPHEAPTGKALPAWREALGPAPLAGLQARLLAAVDAEHRASGYRAVCVGDSGHGLRLGSIDGSVTRVPDTDLNRAALGPAPPTIRRPTRRSVTCWPATPPPAPPWRWSPAPPAARRPRASRCCWMRCSPPARRSSPLTGSGSSTGTSAAPGGWPGCGHRHPRADPRQKRPRAAAGSCPTAVITATWPAGPPQAAGA